MEAVVDTERLTYPSDEKTSTLGVVDPGSPVIEEVSGFARYATSSATSDTGTSFVSNGRPMVYDAESCKHVLAISTVPQIPGQWTHLKDSGCSSTVLFIIRVRS